MNPRGDNNQRLPNTPVSATGPNKTFGSNMPNVNVENKPLSDQIYGNDNYINTNLQGYDRASQNIINVDKLANRTTPMDANALESLRRQQISNPNQPEYGPTQNQMYSVPPSMPVAPPVDIHPSTADDHINYLNSISPKHYKKTSSFNIPSKFFIFGGIGVVAIIMLVAIVGALGQGGPSFSARAAELGKSIANLREILSYGENNQAYNSPELSGVTAEAQLILTSHQHSLNERFPLAVDEEGKSTEAEADEKVSDKLDKAKAAGNLANVYRRELDDRLNDMKMSLTDLYKSSKDDKTQSAINDTYMDIDELLRRIDSAHYDNGGKLTD